MHRRTQQRGASLIEVLVAFLIVALSLVGAQRLQSTLRHHADVARQRSEAVRIAQVELARAQAEDSPTRSEHTGTNTRFSTERRVHAHADLALRTTDLRTHWSDRQGQAQSVHLASATGTASPVYSAALLLPPPPDAFARPVGRHADLPPGARPLGNGRSVFKPREGGAIAIVFDTASGQPLQQCRVDARLGTRQLRAEHLQDCDRIRGSLLSGHVRFALGESPDAARANDTPLPMRASLQLAPPSYGPATCEVQPMKTARVTRGGRVSTEAVPLDASALDVDATTLDDTGERFSRFFCLIVDARWSGQLVFEPEGWALGATAREHRICRVGSTHTEGYRDIAGHLRQQNFVVLRGDQPCLGVPGDPASAGTHNVASASLTPHQPAP